MLRTFVVLTSTLVLAVPQPSQQAFTEIRVELADIPRVVALGLLDDDDVLDVAVVSGDEGLRRQRRVSALVGRGDGTFTEAWSAEVVGFDASTRTSLALADLDNDHHLDMVLGNTPFYALTVRLGDGLATFDQSFPLFFFGGSTNDLSLPDLDDDGLPDLVWFEKCLGVGYVDSALGNGDGTFSYQGFASAFPSPGKVLIDVADVTEDGWDDLVYTSDLGVTMLLGQANHSYVGATKVFLSNVPGRDVSLVDLDQDGHLDVVYTAPLSHTVQVLPGLGGGAFGAAVAVPVGRRPEALVVAHFNHDDRLDIAVTLPSGRAVAIVYADAQGGFSAPLIVKVGRQPIDMAAGDLDGDGDTDLVVANAKEATLSVLLNRAVTLSSR